jgi:hypothetical protein
MRVAVDADTLPPAAPALEAYVATLVRALQRGASPAERLVLFTRPENHARFETLRDARTDVVVARRPLFAGREVADWAPLLDRHPKVGGDLLAGHQQAKLRVMRQLGAQVVHFPADAREMMEIDAPVVLTVHGAAPFLSTVLADALVVHGDAADPALPHGKTFAARFASPGAADADDGDPMLTALGEAYEHALASFEFRKAA